jgi:hypothetical protein
LLRKEWIESESGLRKKELLVQKPITICYAKKHFSYLHNESLHLWRIREGAWPCLASPQHLCTPPPAKFIKMLGLIILTDLDSRSEYASRRADLYPNQALNPASRVENEPDPGSAKLLETNSVKKVVEIFYCWA